MSEGVMVSLDEALDELGMLSNGSRYKREYIQDIEAAYEKRKAENAKWLNWHTRADIVREEDMERKNIPSLEVLAKQQHKDNANLQQNNPAVGQTLHTNGKVEFTNLMSACSNQNVIQDPANTSSTSISIQIGGGNHHPYMMRGVSPMTNPIRGLNCSASMKDSQFVTNITVKQNQSGFPPYSNLKLEKDSYNRRIQFNPRRGCEYRGQYSSPYYHHRVITLPPSISSSSTQPTSSTSMMMNGQYTPSCNTRNKTYPHTSVLKLSGVLTSFKHRTFRTRPRVRFCVREENTDELTAQLSNIKLNTASFNLNNGCATSDQSCPTSTTTTTTIPSSLQVSSRRESTPDNDNLRMAVRNRLLLEPRSRHMSLEPNDPLLRSDLLAISLNHLDLEDESVTH